jgi:hypothetical protein
VRIYVSILIIVVVCFATAAFGAPASEDGTAFESQVGVTSSTLSGALPYGAIPGYTDDIDDEVISEPKEMVLMEKPAFLNGPNFHDKIFNSELTSEFLFRYQQTFGRTEAEQYYFLTNKDGYYNGPTGLTATEQDADRNAFAQYMVKRLAEYHTENMMKNDPQLRHVYEVKQAMSNMKMNVGPQVNLDMMYSFVGNYADINIKNPWVETKVTITMDPGSVVPTAPSEVYFWARKPITRTIRTEGGFTFYNKGFNLLVVQQFSPVLALNLSETLPVVDLKVDPSREELTMLGLSYVF